MKKNIQKKVLLSLNEETNDILQWFSDYTNFNRSELVRFMLYYFNENKDNLYDIIRVHINKILEEERKINRIWMDKIHKEIEQQIRDSKKKREKIKKISKIF